MRSPAAMLKSALVNLANAGTMIDCERDNIRLSARQMEAVAGAVKGKSGRKLKAARTKLDRVDKEISKQLILMEKILDSLIEPERDIRRSYSQRIR